MNNPCIDSTSLTADQRRLLGGWRDILDDIRHLCKSLKAMPDGLHLQRWPLTSRRIMHMLPNHSHGSRPGLRKL